MGDTPVTSVVVLQYESMIIFVISTSIKHTNKQTNKYKNNTEDGEWVVVMIILDDDDDDDNF